MSIDVGISVYPDISSLEEIKQYIKLASKYKVKRVFSSMFSLEGEKNEILGYFDSLIKYAHKYSMEVALDVNPILFDKLGASYDDLSVFKSIDVDILRMDLSYGAKKDAILINNPYNIKIEFNSSLKIIKELMEEDVLINNVSVCHNFYPQRYTGLSLDKFIKINEDIKNTANIKISAFITSTASNTHGVWNAKNGLPTIEILRDKPIDLQARLLLSTKNVDMLLIGNAYATEEELQSLYNVLIEQKEQQENDILKMLVEYGVVKYEEFNVVKIRPTIENDISETEKNILYNFNPQLSLGDNSEWMWRSRMPRFKYSNPKYKIESRKIDKEYFEYGDIVVVNDNYKHYAGELQIILKRIKNDGERNLIAHIDGDEQILMQQLKDFSIVEMIK